MPPRERRRTPDVRRERRRTLDVRRKIFGLVRFAFVVYCFVNLWKYGFRKIGNAQAMRYGYSYAHFTHVQAHVSSAWHLTGSRVLGAQASRNLPCSTVQGWLDNSSG